LRVQVRAVKAAEKAMLEQGEDGYDGSGDIPWEKRSTRVAIGVMLAAKASEVIKEQAPTNVPSFGLLVIRDRIESKEEWERLAAEVDAGPKVIEAKVVSELPDSLSGKDE